MSAVASFADGAHLPAEAEFSVSFIVPLAADNEVASM